MKEYSQTVRYSWYYKCKRSQFNLIEDQNYFFTQMHQQSSEEFQKQPTSCYLCGEQVSGKSPKLLSQDKSILFKGYIQRQDFFFQQMNAQNITDQSYPILQYLPKYYGEQIFNQKPNIINQPSTSNQQMQVWLKHIEQRYDEKNGDHKFISLENFANKYKAVNILDIKIGGRSEKKHKITEGVRLYKLKLNGMRKNNDKIKDFFRSKYILNEYIEKEEIIKVLAFFFHTGTKVDVSLLEAMIQKLKGLALAFRSLVGWKLVSSSIVLIYDFEEKSRFDVRFIDFGRAKKIGIEAFDDETSDGIENTLRFLIQVREKAEEFEQVENPQCDVEGVIPQRKRVKKPNKMA